MVHGTDRLHLFVKGRAEDKGRERKGGEESKREGGKEIEEGACEIGGGAGGQRGEGE
eukprot:jgi/Botrbrau1/8857/Bobra.50_2s0014.1